MSQFCCRKHHFRVKMTSAPHPQTMTDETKQLNNKAAKPPELELNLRPGVQMSPPRATARFGLEKEEIFLN